MAYPKLKETIGKELPEIILDDVIFNNYFLLII